MRRRWVLLSLLLVSCAGSTREVTVLAAASLAEVAPTIMAANYSFDGSAALLDQLRAGAPADVFLSADKATMDRAVASSLIEGQPVQFASNSLVLVTPQGNPGGVTGLDGSISGKKLVICARQVPCGAAATQLAARLGVTLTPVSEEMKVTDVLGKVVSGQADAGMVYATDAVRAGAKVVTIVVPGAERVPTTYWAGVVTGTKQPEAARAYIARLVSGRDTLTAFGFGPPL